MTLAKQCGCLFQLKKQRPCGFWVQEPGDAGQLASTL